MASLLAYEACVLHKQIANNSASQELPVYHLPYADEQNSVPEIFSRRRISSWNARSNHLERERDPSFLSKKLSLNLPIRKSQSYLRYAEGLVWLQGRSSVAAQPLLKNRESCTKTTPRNVKKRKKLSPGLGRRRQRRRRRRLGRRRGRLRRSLPMEKERKKIGVALVAAAAAADAIAAAAVMPRSSSHCVRACVCCRFGESLSSFFSFATSERTRVSERGSAKMERKRGASSVSS